MTKFSLEILHVLNENEATTQVNAMSIRQIYDQLSDKKRKAYSTIYRHLLILSDKGYVDNALQDGLSSTYMITSTGQQLHDAMYKTV